MLNFVERTHYRQEIDAADLFDEGALRRMASMGSDDSFDLELAQIGRAAQSYVEKLVGRPFAKTVERNYWPCFAKIMWMKPNSYLDASDTVHLKYLDEDGAEQEVDADKYYLHMNAPRPSIRITDDALDPDLREDDEAAIWSETMTGMVQNRLAQESARQAARILVQGMWYGGPQATVDVVSPQALQKIKMLVHPYRRRGYV